MSSSSPPTSASPFPCCLVASISTSLTFISYSAHLFALTYYCPDFYVEFLLDQVMLLSTWTVVGAPPYWVPLFLMCATSVRITWCKPFSLEPAASQTGVPDQFFQFFLQIETYGWPFVASHYLSLPSANGGPLNRLLRWGTGIGLPVSFSCSVRCMILWGAVAPPWRYTSHSLWFAFCCIKTIYLEVTTSSSDTTGDRTATWHLDAAFEDSFVAFFFFDDNTVSFSRSLKFDYCNSWASLFGSSQRSVFGSFICLIVEQGPHPLLGYPFSLLQLHPGLISCQLANQCTFPSTLLSHLCS